MEEVFKFYPHDIFRQSAKYFERKSTLITYEKLLHYFIFFAFLILGIFQWYSSEILKNFGSEYIRAIIFFTSYLIFFAILELPFDIYQTFKIEKEYNFNHTTPVIFIKDLIINSILSFIILTILLSIIIAIIKIGGNYWYVYASAAVIFFYVLLMYLYPVLIAPLFNKFEPLKNKELESKAGFPIKSIFQMDALKDLLILMPFLQALERIVV